MPLSPAKKSSVAPYGPWGQIQTLEYVLQTLCDLAPVGFQSHLLSLSPSSFTTPNTLRSSWMSSSPSHIHSQSIPSIPFHVPMTYTRRVLCLSTHEDMAA